MEKPKVEVLSTCMLKATRMLHVDESKIQLTPFDLEYLFLDYMQTGLLFKKPTPAQEVNLVLSKNTLFIDQLKESLSKTLSFFPPYAGRLTTNIIDDGARCNFSLDCNNAGALFLHALANDLFVADIVIPKNPSSNIVHSFFPLNGVRSYQGISQPLLAIQITELIDGLFIGCTFNHVAGDGTSFWRFIDSWAKISHVGVGVHAIPTHPPVLKRGFPFDFQSPINIGCNEKLIAATHRKRFHVPLLEERVFHFSKESIAKLKEKANLGMNTDKISCLQALIAHPWISMIRSRSIGANEETTFEIPIEFRNKLNPPLPDRYFGNAIFRGLVTLSVREISNRGLAWTAWQINRMIASCGHEQINTACKSWIKKPTFLRIENQLPKIFFILVNSPRFNVYGNDFGWGKPVAARTGKGMRFDGRVTIYAGAEQGSVDVEVCLSRHAMAKM